MPMPIRVSAVWSVITGTADTPVHGPELAALLSRATINLNKNKSARAGLSVRPAGFVTVLEMPTRRILP